MSKKIAVKKAELAEFSMCPGNIKNSITMTDRNGIIAFVFTLKLPQYRGPLVIELHSKNNPQ